MSETCPAPWSPEQIKNLTEYQKIQPLHPFTCGCSGDVILTPTTDGWVCPKGCGYVQDWAYDYMANGEAVKVHKDMMAKFGRLYCTGEEPWDKQDGKKVIHLDAKEVDTGDDYTVRYECPHCGTTWKQELPE